MGIVKAPACWSCEHFRRIRTGPVSMALYRNYCAGKHRGGFPDLGKRCRDYSYEPGSDELEYQTSTRTARRAAP